jgi:hypothetical protein
MKTILFILLAYVSLLTVQPLACEVFAAAKQHGCCADNSACAKEKSTENKDQQGKQNKDNPCPACCSIQNCTCYFVPIAGSGFQYAAILTAVQKIRLVNEGIISNYSPDCWHPPKTA